MKNLIVLAATLVLSTSAVAGNSSWAGQSGTVAADGCSFFNIAAGVISRTGNVWTTTRGGSISVRSRGTANISVTSDNVLRNSSGAALTPAVTATVDYTGAGATRSVVQHRSGEDTVAAGSLSVRGLTETGSQLTVFTIGGTATMTAANGANPLDQLDNGTTYKIVHTATCEQ